MRPAPLTREERTKVADLVTRMRPRIFEPWPVQADIHFHFLLRDQQLFCTRVLQVVVESYQDQELNIDKHIYLIIKIFRVLNRRTKSHIDPFQYTLLAIMHDVGKALVSKKVFRLPRALTQKEKVMKRRHSVFGEALCRALGEPLTRIAPIVRAHHEDWAGTGFPDGLKGRRIPLAARLLRVADVMSALSINRHYRKAYTKHQTLEMMRDVQDREEIFDPSFMPFLNNLIELT